MGMSGQRHAPAALYPRGKDPRYPLYRRLGGPQSRSGHRGRRKNPLPLPGIEPRSPGRPARSQTLYCLSYPGSSKTIYCTSKHYAVKSTRNISLFRKSVNRCPALSATGRKLSSDCIVRAALIRGSLKRMMK
jgi:hypothetical protein